MTDPPTTVLDCIDPDGNGLREEIVKQGDRFGHAVSRVRQGESQLLFTSSEGTPDDFSPPSPPFAELHRQGDIVFLSGATTLGHWSASVCVREDGVQFEVACRLRKPSEFLGSTYQSNVAQINAATYELLCGEDTVAEHNQATLQITPLATAANSYPLTVQWRYSVSLKQ